MSDTSFSEMSTQITAALTQRVVNVKWLCARQKQLHVKHGNQGNRDVAILKINKQDFAGCHQPKEGKTCQRGWALAFIKTGENIHTLHGKNTGAEALCGRNSAHEDATTLWSSGGVFTDAPMQQKPSLCRWTPTRNLTPLEGPAVWCSCLREETTWS